MAQDAVRREATLYMLLLFPKNEQDALTAEQTRRVRAIIEVLGK